MGRNTASCRAAQLAVPARPTATPTYDRFLDALTAAKSSACVKNTATAFGLLLDMIEGATPEAPRRGLVTDRPSPAR